MLKRPWDIFAREKLAHIIDESSSVLDIGGGLRIDSSRSNRLDPKNAWIRARIEQRGVRYRILDYVPDFHPDLVGDIQALPLPDASEEAIICNAVFEHVENPFKAASELYRVLKPGGRAFVYVPFLYYYHAHEGYYGDYWRYTPDSIQLLFAPFAVREIQSVRGAIETLVRLTPLGRVGWCAGAAYLLDRLFGKLATKQVSGYFVYLQK